MTRTAVWRMGGGLSLRLGPKPCVMGIVNVTPDSFSDGGRYLDADAAVRHGQDLLRQGADILDVGGESTRPGSDPVLPETEAERIVPVVRRLAAGVDVPISVDTRRAAVAEAAIAAGAIVVNDVSALSDPRMAQVVASSGAGLAIMHMKGDPKTMQTAPVYDDVVAEVRDFLAQRAQVAEAAGVRREAIVVDPGIGFGKRTGHGVEDNLTLLDRLAAFKTLGYPVLVGASRKRFIASVLGGGHADRLEGSLAAAAVAVYNGADIVRAHDVAATRRVADLAAAIRTSRTEKR